MVVATGRSGGVGPWVKASLRLSMHLISDCGSAYQSLVWQLGNPTVWL